MIKYGDDQIIETSTVEIYQQIKLKQYKMYNLSLKILAICESPYTGQFSQWVHTWRKLGSCTSHSVGIQETQDT